MDKTKIKVTNISFTNIYTNKNIALQKFRIPCDIVICSKSKMRIPTGITSSATPLAVRGFLRGSPPPTQLVVFRSPDYSIYLAILDPHTKQKRYRRLLPLLFILNAPNYS